ncbi:MAG: (Fe-S)-binding protein [Candidatus Hodarchaeota archaeon]
MSDGKELLKVHEDDMWRCARCSLCKFPPLAQIKSSKFYSVCCSIDYGNFHPWSGGGKLIMGFSLLSDRIKKISENMRDAILQCTLCGACDVSCKYSTDIELEEIIFDLRRYMVEKIGPHPIHKKYADVAGEFHNPYGEPHEKRQDWIKNTNVKEKPDSKTLFFTGCTAAYRQQEIAEASVEILNKINYDFQLSKEEFCCASPIYRSGQIEAAKEYFEHNIELFNKMGVEEVVTACPGCYAMFVAEYPKHLTEEHFKMWESIKFLHMTKVIEQSVRQKKIQFKEMENKPIVTYHDPCHLGRGAEPWVPEWKGIKKKVYNQVTIFDPPKKYRRGAGGIYDEPRTIFDRMNNTIQFVEMLRINEYAYCCGSGGGVKAGYPEMAIHAVTERLEEAEHVLNEASADDKLEKILVSACPFCKTNFEDGLKATGKNIKYMDINQLVLEWMVK